MEENKEDILELPLASKKIKKAKKKMSKKQQKENEKHDSDSSYGSEATEDETFIDEETKKKRKKKYIRFGIIAGIILIIIVLAIALPLALKGSGGDNDDPNNPNNPIFIAKNNPYYASLNLQSQDSVSGTLQTQNYFNKNDFQNLNKVSKLFSMPSSVMQSLRKAFNQFTSQDGVVQSDDHKITEEQNSSTPRIDSTDKADDNSTDSIPKLSIDWTKIKPDSNNRFISNLSFSYQKQAFFQHFAKSFDMIDFKVARFTLTDLQMPRFSIPEEAVNKPSANTQMRLQNIGFKYIANPFSFSFSNTSDSNNRNICLCLNYFLDFKNECMSFMDKYIQMDFKLNSQRIFGLGERVREFNLSEGTYTMWSTSNVSGHDSGAGRRQANGVPKN